MSHLKFPEKDGVDARYAVRGLIILLGIVAAGLVGYTLFQSFISYLEFKEIGSRYTSIFKTNMQIKLLIGGIAFLLVFLIFGVNHHLMLRVIVRRDITMKPFSKPLLTFFLSFVFAFFCGRLLSNEMYDSFLTALNATEFGYGDVLFNRDIGYYVFSRPFLQELISYISTIWLGLVCYTFLVYLITAARLSLLNRRFLNETAMLNHMACILVGFILIQLLRYRFALEELLYAKFDNLTGAGYTDFYIWGIYYRIAPFLALALLAVAAIFYWKKHFRGVILTFLVFPTCLLAVFIAAHVADNFIVEPNAYALQKSSIEANWYSTRRGFGLEELLTVSDVSAGTVTKELLEANAGARVALNNLNLADTSAETLSQFQQGDAYTMSPVQYMQLTVDGDPTLVFVSTRESNNATKPGNGLIMGYASQTDADGNPVLLMEGLPVLTRSESMPEVAQSELFYSPQAADTMITDHNSYHGSSGLSLSFWNRVALALRNHGNGLSDTKAGTTGLLNRSVLERIRTVAPFFRYDTPYSVITDDGRIVWVVEAYATTDRYPSANTFDGINYIRNVATVTVDAYDGTLTFYQKDADPILTTYQKIYPFLFSKEELPEDIARQLRAPEQLFKLQLSVLEQYHESDLKEFYQQMNVWSAAKISQNEEESKRMEPTWTWVSLSDQNGNLTAKPVLLSLYTDKSGATVTGVFCSDQGKPILYTFAEGQSVLTPQAFENNLTSAQEYLMRQVSWQSMGLNITRGSITPVFTGNTLLYATPIYSVAATGEKRLISVAMGTADRVVVRNTVSECLTALLNAGSLIESPTENLLDIGDLIDAVVSAYDRVSETVGRNDWSAYGNALNELETAIRRLDSGKNSLLDETEESVNE